MKIKLVIILLLASAVTQASSVFDSRDFSEASRYVQIAPQIVTPVQSNPCLQAAFVSLVNHLAQETSTVRQVVIKAKYFRLLNTVVLKLARSPELNYIVEVKQAGSNSCMASDVQTVKDEDGTGTGGVSVHN